MVAPFTHFTFRFGGSCCGALFVPDPKADRHSYIHPGIELSFEPFPEQEGPQQNDLETVETSAGPIFLSLRRQKWAAPAALQNIHSKFGYPKYHFDDSLECHETETETIKYKDKTTWPVYRERKICHAGRQITNGKISKDERDSHKKDIEALQVLVTVEVFWNIEVNDRYFTLDEQFKKAHIYSSPPTFNVIHTERKYPSLILHIYDMKK